MAPVVLNGSPQGWEAARTVLIRTSSESQFERVSRGDGAAATGIRGPVILDPRSSGLIYEPYYGLREKPFSLTSDSRFFYHSRSHAPAFADLVAGIRRRESLNVLSGDIGTGKTTLCRAVLQNLDRKTFSAFVPDPFASREDLLKVLLVDFGVASVDDLTSGRLKDASRTELSYLLYEFLGTLAPLQAFAVVIIDEAQNLSVPLLEEIRILSDADGQLQVVLVGQLELRQKLKLPEMRQLDQRVSVHCTLEALGGDGVTGYIEHRLYTAGGSPDRIKFSAEAIEAVYQVSGGVPRIINRVCDRALHHGYLRRVGTIDREIVEAAIPDAVPPVRQEAPLPPVVHLGPGPAPPQFPDPVDVWLAAVDGRSHVAKAALRAAPPQPTQPGDAEQPPPARSGFVLRRQMPRTPIEQFTDRWLRRIGIATVALVAAVVAFLGFPTVMDISSDLLTASTQYVSAPDEPALPAPLPPPAGPSLQVPQPPDVAETPVAAAVPAAEGAEVAAVR
jgi:type II secretory pathway predicted ATPase ExeA